MSVPMSRPCVLCRGDPLTREHDSRGPYRRPVPRVLDFFWKGVRFDMSEVPLYHDTTVLPPAELSFFFCTALQ